MQFNLHIGNMIKNYIDQKNMIRADIARALNTPNTAIYAYEKRDSLKTSTILRLCYALKYNFFMDIANSLPRDFEQSPTLSSEKDELIKQQAAEINKLKLENDLLKELIIAKQK